VGLDENGDLDEVKTKQLVKLFRPDVNGNLSMLDFVKSCDEVYRRVRTFRAAVENSSIINNAYESIFDGIFYFLMAIVILLIFEMDVWKVLVSVSSLVVSFAFAFGSAVSKFMEVSYSIAWNLFYWCCIHPSLFMLHVLLCCITAGSYCGDCQQTIRHW
jgi:hypothetical protein